METGHLARNRADVKLKSASPAHGLPVFRVLSLDPKRQFANCETVNLRIGLLALARALAAIATFLEDAGPF
jgi:hypothetical protein